MNGILEIRRKSQAAHGCEQASEHLQAAEITRDINAIHKAVQAYHARHTPPRLTDEYWQSAINGIHEMSVNFNNDPFVVALLVAVYGEMERGYNALKASVDNKQTGIDDR